ncbi:hypothetical protein J6590_082395 [Homalodisca vitripennis]|nr:hypothetical protein J6590_082395 [Homalodisca vitripennis]
MRSTTPQGQTSSPDILHYRQLGSSVTMFQVRYLCLHHYKSAGTSSVYVSTCTTHEKKIYDSPGADIDNRHPILSPAR